MSTLGRINAPDYLLATADPCSIVAFYRLLDQEDMVIVLETKVCWTPAGRKHVMSRVLTRLGPGWLFSGNISMLDDP